MTRSASISRLTSEFDDFLFAPIGDERNGMLLSVLSALARLGVDPWLEAAHLTHMPEETATERMASLIAALPDRPSAQPDSASVAARLIALLPRGNATNKALRAPTPDGPAAAKSQTILFVNSYGPPAGRTIFHGKPPIAGAGWRRDCAGFQHRLAAEVRPVTNRWPAAAGSPTDAGKAEASGLDEPEEPKRSRGEPDQGTALSGSAFFRDRSDAQVC